jgi:hypothetical protein
MAQNILSNLPNPPCQRFTLSDEARSYLWQQHIPMFIIEWLIRDGSTYPDKDNTTLFIFDSLSFEKILHHTSALSTRNLRRYFGMYATVKDKKIIQINRRTLDKNTYQSTFYH